MTKIKSVNIFSFANLFAFCCILTMIIYAILMVVLGGVIGATSGSLEGAGVLAGGGFISGLIGIVIAGPLSWVAGLIYASFINIALKAIGGLSVEME